MDKDSLICEEYSRISVYFESLDENKRQIIEPLLRNAAFMKVTLEELQNLIARDGAVERYQNGENQYGMKQSAALQSYNTLVKNYSSVIKTLYESMPRDWRPPEPEETPQERRKRLNREAAARRREAARREADTERLRQQFAELRQRNTEKSEVV